MTKPQPKPDSPLLREQVLPLAHFAKVATVRRSYDTLRRWAVRGLRGKDGRVVFLETMFIGPVRHTSHEALRRFMASFNE